MILHVRPTEQEAGPAVKADGFTDRYRSMHYGYLDLLKRPALHTAYLRPSRVYPTRFK